MSRSGLSGGRDKVTGEGIGSRGWSIGEGISSGGRGIGGGTGEKDEDIIDE